MQFPEYDDFENISDESVCEKTNNLGFDQVRHKPNCRPTVTEDGKRLEILDLDSRGIGLSV